MMRAEIDESSDDLADPKVLQKALGLHPELVREIQYALDFFVKAIGGAKIGLSISAVNPVARKLHLSANTNKCSGPGQAYMFKPRYIEVKSLSTTVLVGFLGQATPEYLKRLDAKHEAQLGELTPRNKMKRKLSRSSSGVGMFKSRRTPSTDNLLQEPIESDEFMFFENLPLKFPLSHLCSICKKKILKIQDVQLQESKLQIYFEELDHVDYSIEGKIIAHERIQNGCAVVQLSAKQIELFHMACEESIGKNLEWCTLLRRSKFYDRYKRDVIVGIFDDSSKARLTLGVRNRNGKQDDLNQVLAISDVDVDLVF